MHLNFLAAKATINIYYESGQQGQVKKKKGNNSTFRNILWKYLKTELTDNMANVSTKDKNCSYFFRRISEAPLLNILKLPSAIFNTVLIDLRTELKV